MCSKGSPISAFRKDMLAIDPELETSKAVTLLRETVRTTFRRSGAVVGISGGVDSSVVLALCARAFGPQRVRAVVMPERDSDPASERLAREVAGRFGITPELESLSEALDGLGCYRRRDEAIKRLFPEYEAQAGYAAKIGLSPDVLERDTLNAFCLTVVRPDGTEVTTTLPAPEFRQIVAASNFKQRTRMSMLFYHAELHNYSVVGTANRLEHGLGFFVKYGDAGVDVQPIAHLYKTQVYRLAEYLGIPQTIVRRTPTSDTYSAPSTQQEFYFQLPFELLDLILAAIETGVPAEEVARVLEMPVEQIARAYTGVESKRRAAAYLHAAPVLMTTAPLQAAASSSAPSTASSRV